MTEHPSTGETAGPPEPAQAAPVPPAAPDAPAVAAAPPEAAPAYPPDPTNFEEMQLRADVLGALIEMGWLQPTEVQRSTFWRILAGRDLMVQARTGSGKTGAFAVPLAQKLVDASRGEVQVLALCPTRELALQVANECERIGNGAGLKVAAVYGGAPMGKQIDALRGGAQIVAGTPGRVLDHLRRGTLTLDKLRVLVLDECDEMLSMGFYEEISEILKRCPTNRQTLLFSATIPEDIERIAQKYMQKPEKVMLSGGRIDVVQITHAYYMVSGMGRSRDLVAVLHIEKPDSAIIFCNTREETSSVAEYLRKAGFDAEAISSDLTQKDRERVMGRMRAQNLHYLVATDIAARGIDISDLSHVINYTFPESPEIYVHRTGRTGRAGKTGVAISLISPRELGNFYYLKLTYKIRPEERQLPTPEEEATRLDGDRMEKVLRGLGERRPTEEWRRLARRAWSTEGGESVIAALLEDWFDRASRPAPGSVEAIESPAPAAGGETVAAVEAAVTSEEARPERPAREGRERHRRDRGERGERGDRGGRFGERGRREDRRQRRRDDRPREAREVHDERPRPTSEESAATPAPRETEAPALVAVEAPAVAPEAVAAPVTVTEAPAPSKPREERGGRERRRRGGRDRDASRAPAENAAPAKTPAPTIDVSDGREFWEVWADENVSPSTPAPAAAAPEPATPPEAGESGESGEAAPSEPGAVRLYLNLGRRDRLRPDEVERWLGERGVVFRRAHVRNTHTYVYLDESAADAAIAALNGSRYGDREVVCERARRS